VNFSHYNDIVIELKTEFELKRMGNLAENGGYRVVVEKE